MIVNDGAGTFTVDDGTAEVASELIVGHEWMRAEGDQVIACGGARGDFLLKEAEHLRHGHGACAVGDDDEDAFGVDGHFASGGRDELAKFVVGDCG